MSNEMRDWQADEIMKLEQAVDKLEAENEQLQAQLTELRAALEPISTALDAYGVGWCRNIATAALLQESSDE